MKVSNKESFEAFKYLARKTNNLYKVWTNTGMYHINDIDKNGT
jgi:hypothetical protein